MNSAPERILITQASTPALVESYQRLADLHPGVVIDFRPFSQLTPVPVPVFRTYKQTIIEHSAILFTNKVTIDHFFELAQACDIKLPPTQKYFFPTAQLQKYLGKYTEIKKRKVFYGKEKLEDLLPIMPKHKGEKFLFPSSDLPKDNIQKFFKDSGREYTEIIIQETSFCDLSDLNPADYSVIVFFNPLAVKAFASNFPGYTLASTKLATFGSVTATAVKQHGWKPAIHAPQVDIPSMVVALEVYLKELRKEL